MLTEDDEQWLIQATERAGVGIVSDEVYIDAAWEAPEITPLWQKCNHAISVNSLTKCYGLGSIRFGWAIGAEKYADRMTRALQNFQGMLAVPSIAIARAAWPQLEQVLELMQRRRSANLPLLEEVLSRHKINWSAPPFGIFGCIPLPYGWSGVKALKKYGVSRGLLATPCEMFDSTLTGWLRIAWGAEPTAFEDSVSSLDHFLDDLKQNEP
jgi:histidinol-phosphate/aromatic aminotransferase/cobyric acid decarboxylase-like protein